MNGEHAMELLARADPVRGEDLEARMAAARPRVMLPVRESPPAAGRRAGRPLRIAFPAIAAAILGALLLTSVLSDRTPRALAIERTDRYISLRIEDPAADAVRMNRELREHGVDVEVQTVPVPPDEVGHWVGGRAVWPGEPERGDQHRLGDERIRELNEAARGWMLVRSPGDPGLIRVPTGFDGHWLLYAGRAARPGERPWIQGNPPGAF